MRQIIAHPIRKQINHVKLAGVAAAAVLAFTVFGISDARAADNVKDFSCTTDPFGVHVDVSGLGNQTCALMAAPPWFCPVPVLAAGAIAPVTPKNRQSPLAPKLVNLWNRRTVV
jgi:hypothetical protein